MDARAARRDLNRRDSRGLGEMSTNTQKNGLKLL